MQPLKPLARHLPHPTYLEQEGGADGVVEDGGILAFPPEVQVISGALELGVPRATNAHLGLEVAMYTMREVRALCDCKRGVCQL